MPKDDDPRNEPGACPRAVLFDLDGTLIDTIELILESYRHTVAAHGLDPVPDPVWLEGLGIPLRVQFRRFTTEPREIEALIATYLEHNRAHHDALVRRYPGVLEGVRALAARGARLGLVTSKMHGGLEQGLKSGGYEDLFEVLIGADDVENPKPHPEPVLRAAEQLGVDPRETIFVGDSPHDMASGRAAGARIAAVSWGPFPRRALEPYAPDFWLASPASIPHLLGGEPF
jgi:pyrophosphatase PpaX